jgi:hypothetical protein
MNKRIESLLKNKERNDELERLLDLYEQLDYFIENKPTILDRIKMAMTELCDASDGLQSITYSRIGMRNCELDIKVPCGEVALALRDYYERKIIELTKTDE